MQLLKNDDVDVYLLKWQDIHNILSSEKKQVTKAYI